MPVGRDPFRLHRASSIKYASIEACRKSNSPKLKRSKTFRIHLLPSNEEEELSCHKTLFGKNAVGSEVADGINNKDDEVTVIFDTNVFDKNDVGVETSDSINQKDDDVTNIKHPRFGLEDYPTIISRNIVAENDPYSWAPLQSQVAGHGLCEDMKPNDVQGILISSEGQILKPVQNAPGNNQRGLTEIAFYSHIIHSNDFVDTKIRECIPKFYGIEQFESDAEGNKEINNFLILEDITQGYELAAVMDIKIGRKVIGPDASAAKRARASRKSWPTGQHLGFKVSGILAHSLKPEDEGNNDIPGKVYSKKGFGQKLTTHTVWKIPDVFYDSEYSGKVEILNDIFVKKLEEILEIFEAQSRYHIYGSSLLFTYDANAVRKFRNGKISGDSLETFVNIKLIDFANVYEANGEKDENFLSGLRNVITVFRGFSVDNVGH